MSEGRRGEVAPDSNNQESYPCPNEHRSNAAAKAARRRHVCVRGVVPPLSDIKPSRDALLARGGPPSEASGEDPRNSASGELDFSADTPSVCLNREALVLTVRSPTWRNV